MKTLYLKNLLVVGEGICTDWSKTSTGISQTPPTTTTSGANGEKDAWKILNLSKLLIKHNDETFSSLSQMSMVNVNAFFPELFTVLSSAIALFVARNFWTLNDYYLLSLLLHNVIVTSTWINCLLIHSYSRGFSRYQIWLTPFGTSKHAETCARLTTVVSQR